MQVKINEDRLKDTDPETGQQYSLGKGDVVTVSDTTGRRWCAYGWAADVSGNTATGERIPGAREVLNVQDVTIKKVGR
jgi:hypothetical protein